VLQPDPLKLGYFNFNVIINITLGSGVAVKPKTLEYSFAKKKKTLILLDLSFFLIFFMQKN
jgi:hypothetical protein